MKIGLNKTHPKEYAAIANAVSRCYSPNNRAFQSYGARGIKVCDRWRKNYAQFVQDMGAAPAGSFLDRIDDNGDYCPNNCRWIDAKSSNQNMRRIHWITWNGRTQSAAAWERETGASAGSIVSRLQKGETDPARIFSPEKLPHASFTKAERTEKTPILHERKYNKTGKA